MIYRRWRIYNPSVSYADSSLYTRAPSCGVVIGKSGRSKPLPYGGGAVRLECGFLRFFDFAQNDKTVKY